MFTYEFVSNKESWRDHRSAPTPPIEKVEALDPHTVKITFKEPTGGWFVPFVGGNGMIIPKHIMKDYVGAKSREAPINTKPFGTGPYMVEDFKPGDLVHLQGEPELPRRRQGRLRAHRDEGRRRPDHGRAGGLPDRRVRLLLEPPGRGGRSCKTS